MNRCDRDILVTSDGATVFGPRCITGRRRLLAAQRISAGHCSGRSLRRPSMSKNETRGCSAASAQRVVLIDEDDRARRGRRQQLAQPSTGYPRSESRRPISDTTTEPHSQQSAGRSSGGRLLAILTTVAMCISSAAQARRGCLADKAGLERVIHCFWGRPGSSDAASEGRALSEMASAWPSTTEHQAGTTTAESLPPCARDQATRSPPNTRPAPPSARRSVSPSSAAILFHRAATRSCAGQSRPSRWLLGREPSPSLHGDSSADTPWRLAMARRLSFVTGMRSRGSELASRPRCVLFVARLRPCAASTGARDLLGTL